jgi:hypothetical protein
VRYKRENSTLECLRPIKVENPERRDYMAFASEPVKEGVVYASGHLVVVETQDFSKSLMAD